VDDDLDRGADTSPQSSSTASTNTDTLAEVTVTAQRRAENLQNVPISVTNLRHRSILPF